MICPITIRRIVRSPWILIAFVLIGCGSNGPVILDAAAEQALREDMSRVANEEQAQRSRSTGMSTTNASTDPASSFHPEEVDQR